MVGSETGDAVAPALRSGTLAGEIIAGHELLRLLAVGGMGEVYLARHQGLGVLRAIKFLRADLRERPGSLQRFTREAQVLARLQHNSLVQIIEFGSLANGWPFLAMEYIDGPSLDELLERGPLPITSALIVLEQLAHALHYAHANQVIHRDLKLSNILLRSGDIRQVKIIDFGLARVLDAEGERLTADGQLIGSPTYMAPEQVEGARDATPAVDIYALAGIAYTVLSGQPPFVHKKRVRLMSAHVSDTPPRLSERCPDAPAFLEALLFQCLAKEPERRPHANEIAAQLGHHLRGAALDVREAPPATTVEIVKSPWGSRRGERDVASQLLDEPAPRDPGGLGLTLVTKVMSIVEEIVTYLSISDPELSPLLQLEARICGQLASVERELATVTILLEAEPGVAAHATQRDALCERIRTLNAQQMPLQRRMVEVVEAYRENATGQMKTLFRQMDRALQELQSLRRRFP